MQVPAQYRSIQEAIEKARAGDEVRVAAGTYREYLVLKPGVKLLGEDAKTTTLTSRGTIDLPLITTAADCTVSGFTLTRGNGGAKGTIYVPEGAPLITLNIIHHNDSSGIVIAPNTSPTIKENLIYNNRISGITLTACTPLIIQNEIFQNYGAGIQVQGAAPRIENNHIYQNREAGVSITYGLSMGMLVQARVEGEALVLNNKIENNSAAGIIVENTSPNIIGNTISNRGRPGLLLFGSGALIQGNHLISSGPPAIHINPGSSPVIVENKISGTRRFPILGDTSNATIKNNKIENAWRPKFFFK